jgi:hypothetical protein
MRIHNLLTPFADCMKRWERTPTLGDLEQGYFRHVRPWVEDALFASDARRFHQAAQNLQWDAYRAECLALDPAREEARVRKHLSDVEALFGITLEGEIILYSSFLMMDGYARFDRGTHRVFLGVDESHGRGRYLDVLETHELTHVARESRRETWEGWGLDPQMTQAQFWDSQPVIEHVFGEGLSCLVSELLVPGEPAWHYAYQTEDSLAQVLLHAPAINRTIHAEIRKPHHDSDYSDLYSSGHYGAPVPTYAQYVWGWQFAKWLLRDRFGGDVRRLLTTCSRDFVDDALRFELQGLEPAYSTCHPRG